MTLAQFGVRKPTVANLVMFTLLAAGLIFGLSLRREFFPEVNPDMVVVVAPYPGAAPKEVEQSLAIKIEDALGDLRNIEEIRSTVSEGLATITIEFQTGTNIDAAVAHVKREVDALQDLPQDADRITVSKFEPNLPAIVLSLYGDADEREMKHAIRQMREDLLTLDGISEISLDGVRADEIRVDVWPSAMLEHGLSLPAINDKIARSMREVPGGTVRSSTLNVGVRTMAIEERAARVRTIVVKSSPGGRVIRLGDIATVRDAFADVDIRSRLNGEPAVSLTVYKIGEQDAVDIAEMVKAYVRGLQGKDLSLTTRERIAALVTRPGSDKPPSQRVAAFELGRSRAQATPLPGRVALTTDLARFIVGRLNLLMRNALWGGLLVFITLLLLLNWRTSFWVAIGLVVSLAGTLAVMSLIGITLNLLTMFGLIIVIGLLVDDAIVVAENITRRHEHGEAAEVAAVRGTDQVAWPVVATVLTTVFAFLPLALIDGRMGDLLKWLPLVVGVALLVSLLESLFILPVHMAHSLGKADRRRARGRASWFERIESRFDAGRDRFIYDMLIPAYTRVLRRLLKHRYLTIVVTIAIMIGSWGMVAGGRLEFIFFEVSDSETVSGSLAMSIGTPVERTDEILKRIERVAMAQPEIDSIFAFAGAQGDPNGESLSIAQPHLGQIIMELTPVEDRQRLGQRTSDQLIVDIRKAVGVMAGVKSFRLEGISGGPGGPPISLVITGTNERQLAPTVERVKELLGGFDGVYDITDDADAGQRELRLTLRDGAGELGFTVADIAQQMRGAVLGLEAYTFAGVREDVDVRVTLPESYRRSLAQIEQMHIFTPAGQPVPLGEVVRIEEGQAYATVRRLDGMRAITLTAEVDRAVTNPDTVVAQIRPELKKLLAATPGVEIREHGRQKDMKDSFSTLPLGMAVAAGLIYIVLVWLFSSFTQPFVVMAAIPFATVGMIWGHLIMGYALTFLSMIGFVALSGVVVNDSLILMQFYNERRRDGQGVAESVLHAGRARIRAILLTTITTVLGLLPLMLERSFQAKFLIPMAVTISFGLMSATAIILIVLPCLLVVFEDMRRMVTLVWTGRLPEDVAGREWDGGVLAAIPDSIEVGPANGRIHSKESLEGSSA